MTTKGWSTRELADMAGATVKAVRHYHRVGLLPEPERRTNGYKVYEREHLDRLLHIVRLREIGLPLAQIREITREGAASGEVADRLIEHIDDSIRRLQATRADLVAASGSAASGSSGVGEHGRYPRGFADLASHLSDSDRVASLVMARHYSDEAMASIQAMNASPHPIDEEFTDLPPEATEAQIEDLATRMAPVIARLKEAHPMPEHAVDAGAPLRGEAARSIGRALAVLYHPAQLRVIERALALGAG